jgi:hypothetical protein
MSASEALPWLGVLAFVVAIAVAARARETQVLLLLRQFGRRVDGAVVEYLESEEGYLLTYRFSPVGSPASVERTEHLATRPTVRPTPGQIVSVLYLPSLPSISRASLNAP